MASHDPSVAGSCTSSEDKSISKGDAYEEVTLAPAAASKAGSRPHSFTVAVSGLSGGALHLQRGSGGKVLLVDDPDTVTEAGKGEPVLCRGVWHKTKGRRGVGGRAATRR